jgi:Trypsin-co-occurring domain 1
MNRTIETQVGAHGTIFIEVESPEGMREAGALEKAAQQAQRAFDDAMQTIRTIARGIVENFDQEKALIRPDQVKVEFGIKCSGEVGAVVAKASTDAHFTVSLCWEHHH